MEFASEMVIKATLHGLRITEIPTTLRPDGRSRPSHLRSFRDGWRHLKLMLMLSPPWLFLIPGMTLLISGLILVSVIGFSGGLQMGGTLLGINASIAAAMTALVGFQILLNGVFARRFAVATGLYPRRGTLDLVERHASLERGIVLGLFSILAGGLWLASAFLAWQASGSVAPAPSLTVSRVIPSLLLCLIGTQSVFGSFLMSLIEWTLKPAMRNLPESESRTDSVTEVI